ncbi:MAG: hypothetical protein IPF66_14250 [Holophagales bacterium]|nr:hypothetical protein [Holophagales bacterium]
MSAEKPDAPHGAKLDLGESQQRRRSPRLATDSNVIPPPIWLTRERTAKRRRREGARAAEPGGVLEEKSKLVDWIEPFTGSTVRPAEASSGSSAGS